MQFKTFFLTKIWLFSIDINSEIIFQQDIKLKPSTHSTVLHRQKFKVFSRQVSWIVWICMKLSQSILLRQRTLTTGFCGDSCCEFIKVNKIIGFFLVEFLLKFVSVAKYSLGSLLLHMRTSLSLEYFEYTEILSV